MKEKEIDRGELIKVLKKNIESTVRGIFDDELLDKSITIIYYSAQNWYESLLRSGDTVTGKFVEKVIKDILKFEKKRERDSNLEMFVCGTLPNIEQELKSQYFRIRDKKQKAIMQKTCSLESYSIQITIFGKGIGGVTVNGNIEGNLINEAYGSDIVGIRKGH